MTKVKGTTYCITIYNQPIIHNGGKKSRCSQCLPSDVDTKAETYVNGCIFIKNNWLDREAEQCATRSLILVLTVDNQLKPCRQRVHEEVARIGDCYQNPPHQPPKPDLGPVAVQLNLHSTVRKPICCGHWIIQLNMIYQNSWIFK